MWKQLNIKEIQDIQYEMLCVFDEYCKKHKLKYYLSRGSLLGAVRHQDFIPWDDDLDVEMPRSEYDRFLQIETTDPIKEGMLLCALERENWDYPFTKLFKKDTKIVMENTNESGGQYVWVDVFPLDNIPEDDKKAQAMFNKNLFLAKLHGGTKTRLSNEKKPVKKVGKFFASNILKIYGGKRIAKQMIKNARRYDGQNTKYEGCVVWAPIRTKRLKEDGNIEVTKTFRGREFPVSPHWELYLQTMYGNYMELPPEEERRTHKYAAWRWEQSEN